MRFKHLLKRIKKKVRENKGETLLESLVALVIISFSILSLVTCIITTASINRKTLDLDYSFTPAIESKGTQYIEIVGDGISDVNLESENYTTKNGYMYYGVD